MKRKVVFSLISLMLVGVASSCGEQEHQHNFNQTWVHDEDDHWQECECGVKDGVAEHLFAVTEVLQEPQNDVPGSATMKCSVCAYSKTAEYIAAPSKPLNFQAVLEDNSVTLSWEAPENNGGSALTAYQVYCGTGGADGWKEISLVSQYSYSGLEYDKTYIFSVCAVNISGRGASAENVALTPTLIQ